MKRPDLKFANGRKYASHVSEIFTDISQGEKEFTFEVNDNLVTFIYVGYEFYCARVRNLFFVKINGITYHNADINGNKIPLGGSTFERKGLSIRTNSNSLDVNNGTLFTQKMAEKMFFDNTPEGIKKRMEAAKKMEFVAKEFCRHIKTGEALSNEINFY